MTETQSWKIHGHSRGVLSAAADPLGNFLAAGDGAGILSVWSIQAGPGLLKAQNRECSQPVWSVALCPNRRELAFSVPGALRVWDPDSSSPAKTLATHSRRILSIRYGNDGNALLWTTVEGKVQQTHSSLTDSPQELFSNPSEFSAAQIDKTGQWVAMADRRRDIILWNHNSGFTQKLEGHRGAVSALDFSPQSKYLASGGRDCTVRTWDLEPGRRRLVLRGHTATVLSLSFSPDGCRLASGDSSGKIILWDCDTGRILEHFQLSPPSSADVLMFGCNGLVLAAAGTGSIIHVWDLADIGGVQSV